MSKGPDKELQRWVGEASAAEAELCICARLHRDLKLYSLSFLV